MTKFKSSTDNKDKDSDEEIYPDEDNPQKIVRMAYGKAGLINFVGHLFGLLDEGAIKQVNFFFALNR